MMTTMTSMVLMKNASGYHIQFANAIQYSTGAGKKQPLKLISHDVGFVMIVYYLQGENGSGIKPSSLKCGNSNT
eukprot:11963593-Ditylum_brightwellii.AAC.2